LSGQAFEALKTKELQFEREPGDEPAADPTSFDTAGM
jgi:hypothetical protein